MKPFFTSLFAMLLMTTVIDAKATSASDQLLEQYRQLGATEFSAERGSQLWIQEMTHIKSNGQSRSCTSCHSKSHTNNGAHVRTKKVIEPMARSVNPERYTDIKKIKKWFKRNCKWTVGRECSAQEKGDLLTYLLQQ